MSLTPPQNAVYQYTKTLATLLYIYGYPLIKQWQIMANFVNDPTRKPFNQMFYAGISTPTFQPFPGPNVDTVYGLAWLDLTNTPILLETPDTTSQNRWLSAELVDVFTNVITNIPDVVKNAPAKKYIIVGPNQYNLFCNNNPNEFTIIKSPSNIVWTIVRVEIQNHDVNDALSVLHEYTIDPIFPNAPVLHIDPIDNSVYTSMTFYTVLSGLLMYDNPPASETVLFDQFATIGFTYKTLFVAPAAGSPALLGYQDAITVALTQIIPYGNQYSTGQVTSNNWLGGTKLGEYGDQYLRRAYATFVNAFGANTVLQQFYTAAFQDGTGLPLNGNNDYVIHFNANQIPATNPLWGFTSITGYVLPAQNLYPNAYDKYSVKFNDSDVQYNPDGSLDIYIQHNIPPSGVSNWIPVPLGPFFLIARFYSAEQQFVNNFFMPPVVKVL
jgi:hypothetical protein